MSRFEQEWAVVPVAARWIAVLVGLALIGLMCVLFLLPALASGEPRALLGLVPVFLAALIGAVFLGVFVLLVGYVYADARRRGMNHVLWTLLAIFIPNAIGILLYFILRDPVLVPCPSCGAPAPKGYAYCAGCGAAVRRACAGCHRPVEPGWRNCAHCGAALGATGTPLQAT